MKIGDWGLGIGPNPQSPIPIPKFKDIIIKFIYKLFKILFTLLFNQNNILYIYYIINPVS